MNANSIVVETYESGEKNGKRKPIYLPAGAIPCGVTSGYNLTVHFLVPTEKHS